MWLHHGTCAVFWYCDSLYKQKSIFHCAVALLECLDFHTENTLTCVQHGFELKDAKIMAKKGSEFLCFPQGILVALIETRRSLHWKGMS